MARSFFIIRLLLSRLTFLGAIFNVFPIARPFLAPFKGQVAALADLGWEAVLGFSLHAFIVWLSLRGNYAMHLSTRAPR